MNWVAFGCGLGGLATCGFTSLFAIVFGHLGISAAKRGEADYRGAGITGLVLGYLIAGAYVAYYAFAIIAGMAGGIS